MLQRATLRVTDETGAEQIIELTETAYTLGRLTADTAATIALADAEISRLHARVSRDDKGSWTVTDLFSTNGTKVNGALLEGDQPYPLYDGDVIQIGNSTLTFRLIVTRPTQP